MQTGRVAAMGPCLHNVDFLGSLASSTGFGNLKATEQDVSLRKFKFALAFENSLCGSYMSEKIWKAYALGVVPVVYASREAAAVLPSSDSFINTRDFSSAVRLREHLAEVANDELLYTKYFDWKKRPLSKLNPGFQDLWSRFGDNSTTEFQCCIARGVARALEDFRSNVVPPALPSVGCDTVNQDQSIPLPRLEHVSASQGWTCLEAGVQGARSLMCGLAVSIFSAVQRDVMESNVYSLFCVCLSALGCRLKNSSCFKLNPKP